MFFREKVEDNDQKTTNSFCSYLRVLWELHNKQISEASEWQNKLLQSVKDIERMCLGKFTLKTYYVLFIYINNTRCMMIIILCN